MPDDPRRRLARFSAAQLDALSAVSPSDVEDATRAWRADAPAGFRSLLDAEPPAVREDVRAAKDAKKDTSR